MTKVVAVLLFTMFFKFI